MSQLYGTVQGMRGIVSRRGSDYLKVSAQSYTGSVITELFYDKREKDPITIRIGVSDKSTSNMEETLFTGTLMELRKVIKKGQKKGLLK